MLPTWQGSNPQPPDHQSGVHPTESSRQSILILNQHGQFVGSAYYDNIVNKYVKT